MFLIIDRLVLENQSRSISIFDSSKSQDLYNGGAIIQSDVCWCKILCPTCEILSCSRVEEDWRDKLTDSEIMIKEGV